MNIPDDLRLFLNDSKNLNLSLPRGGEIHTLTFFPATELLLEKFVVDSSELFSDGLLTKNPEEKREFEGYPLVKTCNDYYPEGVLVWFPCFNMFGTADTGHQRILVFPGVDWTQIIKDPMWYINCQWYPQNVAHGEINPWNSES